MEYFLQNDALYKTPIPSVIYSAVTTQWLYRDGVVTVDNCHQHSDYTVD